jgi:hypothetical protein
VAEKGVVLTKAGRKELLTAKYSKYANPELLFGPLRTKRRIKERREKRTGWQDGEWI